MKVSVYYGERTYGNSTHCKASEIRISGSSTNVHIKIDYKKTEPGRSWNWLDAGSVGGAEIEMSLSDAQALANMLNEFASALDTYDPFEESMYARLRLREGHKPKQKIVKRKGVYSTFG